MSAAFGLPEILVTVAGVVLSAAVLRFFLAPARKPAVAAAAGAGGVQEIALVVKGGYTPDTLVLRQGIPARLTVRREEDGECSEELVISDLRVKKFLAPFDTTTIEFTPDRAGTFPMTCGMGMLHGTVIVEPSS